MTPLHGGAVSGFKKKVRQIPRHWYRDQDSVQIMNSMVVEPSHVHKEILEICKSAEIFHPW